MKKKRMDFKYSFVKNRCLLCLHSIHSEMGLCDACFADLPRVNNACPLCSSPMPAVSICGTCQQKKHILHSRMVSAFRYEFPIDIMIHKAKFQQNIRWLKLLSELMKKEMMHKIADYTLPDYVIPVPLHHKRFKQRGFNQSLQLIKPLAKELGLAIQCDTIIQRIRNTQPQSQLDQNKRRNNIKGAFQVKKNIEGLQIALVDDIVSTGATIEEIMRLLKQNGVKEIQIWCLARNI